MKESYGNAVAEIYIVKLLCFHGLTLQRSTNKSQSNY